ncbi:MAG: leucine-rich repeat domain-containing protein, partial [Bacilli bacterium]|nr:leucine-rich repeat domain-containing protein [Bacilli bacterium]
MKEKTKNIIKAATLFVALSLTIGLVTTIAVNENEKTFLCETDRLLDGFTLEATDNTYPNGTDENHPAYSTGLEYSTNESSGEGTIESPFEASVSRGRCTDTAISLPEFYKKGNDYYKVVGIDHDGFNAQRPFKVGDGTETATYDVTSITSLKEFKYVGSQAFAYTSISSVEFSKNLIELSPSTFFHCKELVSTNFVQLEGEATSTTGTYAAISAVGDNCFTDCIKYTGFILPRTLTRIGNGAYQNCLSLTSVFLPATDVVGEHLEVGDYAYAGCTKVTVVYISSKVEKIGAYAFEGCVNAKGYSALTFAALKQKLGETGNGDWNYLFNGSDYDNEGDNDNFLDFTDRDGKGDLMYDQPYFYSLNGDGTCTLDVYDGSVSSEPSDVYLYNVIRTIPETRGAGYPVGRIGQELFKGNTDMTSLVMPDTVKSIGIAAFAGCSNLSTVGLSNSLVEIEAYAFAPWNGASTETRGNYLTSLEIPASVEEIGNYAFPYMYDMMNIEFLGSDDGTSQLKHIGDYAFY